jgi:hypothetical protein
MEDNPLAPTETVQPTEAAPIETGSQQAEPTFYSMIDQETGAFKEGAWEKYPVPEGMDPQKYQNLGRKFNDFNSMAEGYLNLEKLLGREKIPMPQEGDGPEAYDRIYDALGRPKEGENYTVPEGLPEELSNELTGHFREAGLNQQQADKLLGPLQEALAQKAERDSQAAESNVEEAIAALESEVGPRNTPAYAQAVEKAEAAAAHLGLDNELFFQQKGFAVEMLKNYDKLINSNIKGEQPTTISRGQNVQAQIDDILNNPSNRLYQAYRDGDPHAHASVQKLFDQKWEAENNPGR